MEFKVAVSDAERAVHDAVAPPVSRPDLEALYWSDMTYITVE